MFDRSADSADTESKIVCRTRHPVVAPQATVVFTADAHRNAFKVRGRQARLAEYPLGSEDAFSLRKGELAFGYANSPYVTSTVNPNFQAVKTFTCFNGLSQGADIRFMGVVDKGWVVNQGSADTTVTLRRAGTHTIFNTGSQTIRQGELVMWDWPESITARNGDKRPRVVVAGLPQDKFLPTLRPLRMADVHAMFGEITMHMANGGYEDAAGDEMVRKFGLMQTPVSAGANLYTVNEGTSNASARDPVYKYTRWLIAAYKGHDTKGAWSFDNSADDSLLLKHTDNMGNGKRARKEDKVTDADLRGDPKAYVFYIISYVVEQYRLMQQRVIGKAITTATRGQKLDLLLSYYQ